MGSVSGHRVRAPARSAVRVVLRAEHITACGSSVFLFALFVRHQPLAEHTCPLLGVRVAPRSNCKSVFIFAEQHEAQQLPLVFGLQGAALKYLPTIVNDVKLVFDPKELR